MDRSQPLDRLQLLERLIGMVARQRCLGADEAEDFASWATVKLLEQKRAVFEKFEGRSSLATYLTAVVHNLFRDYRIAKWGRFRPSAAARRMGLIAERLEVLLVKDGRSFDEAVEILRLNNGVRMTEAELAEIAIRLPAREPVRPLADEGVLDTLEGDRPADDRLEHASATATAARVEEALDKALRELAPEDRLILKQRLEDGRSVADISRLLGLDQKQLYRRIERLMTGLRRRLEAAGICSGDLHEIVGRPDVEVRVDYRLEGETQGPEPSNQRESR